MIKCRSGPKFAKRSFGQNFLTDVNYIAKIISTLGPVENDTVIEIGPGRGALTEWLVGRAERMIAIELDRDLVPALRSRFGHFANFSVLEVDAVSFRFEEVASPDRPAKLVANLPYNVSTPILQSLASQKSLFSQLVLMFQKEVVDRITASPGNSDRGFLTVITEANFTVEKLFDVPPAAFRPVPKVWSTVARFVPRSDIAVPDSLREVLSAGFTQKRKTILNSMRTRFPDAPEMLAMSGVESSRRAETLTLEEWLTVARTAGPR
jgi:16S rRNA (adenine1518-N6/adenine1519-N6)-dimethyltransferase